MDIDVYSEKYDIHGVIRDYGAISKLFFSYHGKDVEMCINRSIGSAERFENVGRQTLESYISNLAAHEDGRKLQLHYWYIDEQDIAGMKFRIGHGIVTGHKKLEDSIDMHTSAVKAVYVDEDEEELVICTMNSVYHCPLAYCLFEEQDKYPEFIPDYERIKEKYRDKLKYPSIEPGKILLVLANFSYYYFHSIYYVPEGSKEQKPSKYEAHPHIGMFQDSFLISLTGEEIGFRYFPHYQNVEFYDEATDGKPWYIENIGDAVLYAGTSQGLLRLEPGERKEVVKANAEKTRPILPDGDLYPADIIE